MRRLRFLRILLPALLLPSLVVLALIIRDRPAGTTLRGGRGELGGPRAEKLELTDLLGAARRLSVTARVVEQAPNGSVVLEGVERLLIDRESGTPLVVRAGRGLIEGQIGSRRMKLEGGIEAHDDEQGLSFSVPALEVDEANGEARSKGAVSLRASGYEGVAAGAVYSLKSLPTVLHRLEAHDAEGSSVSAETCRLLDRTKDVELTGSVQMLKNGSALRAERVRVQRDDDGKLRNVEAEGAVDGTYSAPPEVARTFRADRMEASSDGEGEVDRVRLSGHAVVGQAEGSLGADLIDADRRHDGAEAGWMVSASGAVIVSTAGRRGRGLLRADTATAEFDDLGHLRKGEARGGVRYEGEGIAASAARGTFEAADAREIVSLYSDLAVKARLARERTRVAADKIVSNPTGSYLDAEGRVEASLLPASAGGGAPSAQALFDGGTVVHFVSERLHATASDGRLHFTGTVRGWQGERNLSADEVTIDQDPETLQAKGHVVSRVPRESGTAVSEADFVRIAADQLEYSGARRKAVYSGSARVRQSEGWVEADTVTVSFAAERGDIEEVESLGKVRFEFHGKDRDGLPVSVTGSADRAVYEPKAQDFWLYGVQAPAQVTRPGTQGGTTTGRVLRYRLDDGTLSVESGGRGRARIRTP